MDGRNVDEQEATRTVFELVFLQVEECFEVCRHSLLRRIAVPHSVSRKVSCEAQFPLTRNR